MRNLIEKSIEKVELSEARQKLLTAKDKKSLPALYAQDGVKDPKVWVKFFYPYGSGTWFATEFDGDDTFFGYAQINSSGELGYFSLKELKRNRVERDMSFTPKPLSKAKADMKKAHGYGEDVDLEEAKRFSGDAAKAYELGRKAWEDGIKNAPMRDKSLMKLLAGKKAGAGADILQAWNDGWHKENAAASVDDLEKKAFREDADLEEGDVYDILDRSKASNPSGEAQALAARIKKEIEKHMPPGAVLKCEVEKYLGRKSIRIVTVLEKDLSKVANRIRENDKALQTFFIEGVNDDDTLKDKLTAIISQGGSLRIKPAPDSYYAFDSVKFGWRKKSGTPDQIVKHFGNYFKKVKKVIQDNKDMIPEDIDLDGFELEEGAKGKVGSHERKLIGETKALISTFKKSPGQFYDASDDKLEPFVVALGPAFLKDLKAAGTQLVKSVRANQGAKEVVEGKPFLYTVYFTPRPKFPRNNDPERQETEAAYNEWMDTLKKDMKILWSFGLKNHHGSPKMNDHGRVVEWWADRDVANL